MSLKNNINNFLLLKNKKIIDAMKVFDQNRCNLAVVVNEKKLFIGILLQRLIRTIELNLGLLTYCKKNLEKLKKVIFGFQNQLS